ncbi:MAG: B12-binding domain-containing radical SAM protein [Syntrophales bacterium]|jgi:radical SAM superfamily enzyme YgiQ (UPF0313 family)|nr:B12-binding domain-containing radical SAM protein [Syntrophales bacterium]MDY0044490.1 radical SAM protein [Syntrophales bacterium]
MNILFINPSYTKTRSPAVRYNRAWPPLDLLTLAALARNSGHRVSLLDLRARPALIEDIKKEADDADAVLLSTSPLDRWQCPDLNYEVLIDLARRLPKEKLILAGAHPTMQPEFILKATGAGAAILEQPEAPFVRLLEAGLSPRGIEGVAFMDKGRIVCTEPPLPFPLENLPYPAYDLINPDDYNYELLGKRLILMETSRGCPYACTFCFKAMYGRKISRKSVKRAVSELCNLTCTCQSRTVYFIDLEFTLDRQWTSDFCHELIARNLNLTWCCQTRADTVDKELLGLMKRSGCRLIHFGVETGSAAVLKKIKKNITLPDIEKTIGLCRDVGIETACFFLFGLPGETRNDAVSTIRFAKKLNPDYASFHIAAPYPKTKIGERYTGTEPFPSHLGNEEELGRLRKILRLAFLTFYFRPSYVAHRLRKARLKGIKKQIRLFYEFIR